MRELLERLENKTGQLLESQVAKTILQQMGGAGRIKAMTGAKHFMADGRSVSFKFPNKGAKKPNYVKITLTPADLYDIEFGRVGKRSMKISAQDKATAKAKGWAIPQEDYYEKLKTIKGIYFDQLIDIFEKTTGLYLRL